MPAIEIRVPDIGDFKNVPVVEVHVKPGDRVEAETSLISLESDKATLDVPSPSAGVVGVILVKVGDKLSQGSVILTMEVAGANTTVTATTIKTPASTPTPLAKTATGHADLSADVVVIGAGPGGYTAAFRAADLGKSVVLIERGTTLGGVCLNVGCIPSKALLHAAKVIDESAHGVAFPKPKIDIDALRGWKDGVVKKLVVGLSGLAKARKVTVMHGDAQFLSATEIAVSGADGRKVIAFEKAIIAVGSEPIKLPFVPHDDPRVIDSTGALDLKDIPKRLLVLGGGIIGLEMATVYHALGSKVTVVELMDQIIPGADKDLVTPLYKRMKARYETIYLKTKVTKVEAKKSGLVVHFDGEGAPPTDTFDKVLVAVGRRPNGNKLAAENAGVAVDPRGFIAVDKQMRTNHAHIFAIGDVVGQPMLAHKATHEGRVAAEVCAGQNSVFDAKVIPNVAYTDPEVAWVGVTESDAKAQGIAYGKGVFPWAASGRSLALGRDEGVTKVLFDPVTERIIGCGIVGPSAGDLIAEAALAIEMGADAHDIGATIHPHPTLSETVAMAAEMFTGSITDLIAPPKKKSVS
jgi:dihydrolipoamide dehydrogenase